MLQSEQCEQKSILPSRLESLTSNLDTYTMGNTYNSKNTTTSSYPRLDNVSVKTVSVIENSSSLNRRRSVQVRSPDDDNRNIHKRPFTFDQSHQQNTRRANGTQKSMISMTMNSSDKVVLQPVMNTSNSNTNTNRVVATVRVSASRENEGLTSPAGQPRSSLSQLELQQQSQRSVALTESEVQNLKDLVMMHLDLAKQQQDTIMEKDRLIAELRTEALTVRHYVLVSIARDG